MVKLKWKMQNAKCKEQNEESKSKNETHFSALFFFAVRIDLPIIVANSIASLRRLSVSSGENISNLDINRNQ
jgi:hypothetical protein